MDGLLSLVGLTAADPTPVWLAIAFGVLAAGATLLGWLVAALRKQWPAWFHGAVLCIAAIAMITFTCTQILPEVMQIGLQPGSVVAVVLSGFVLVILMSRMCHRFSIGGSPLARTGLIVAIAIGLHNIPEGSIAVGFSTISIGAALAAAFAIGVHNVPEGLAIAAPVLAAGGTRTKALAFVLLATAGEIAGVLMAAQFLTSLTGVGVALVLGLVGGVMLAVSMLELLPAGISLVRQSLRHTASLSGPPGPLGDGVVFDHRANHVPV